MGMCLMLSLWESSKISLQYNFITMLRSRALERGIVEGLTIALNEVALSTRHAEHPSTVRIWATAPLPGKDESTPVDGWWAEWTFPSVILPRCCFYSERGRENLRLSQLCVGWQSVPGDAMEGWRRELFNSLAWWQEIVGLELSHFWEEVLVMDTWWNWRAEDWDKGFLGSQMTNLGSKVQGTVDRGSKPRPREGIVGRKMLTLVYRGRRSERAKAVVPSLSVTTAWYCFFFILLIFFLTLPAVCFNPCLCFFASPLDW